jgi:hypothetical protein
MEYQIVIPAGLAETLRRHLLTDRSREQLAVMLAGVRQTKTLTRILGRDLILMPPDAFTRQSAGGLELDRSVHRDVLRRAAAEGLSEVDFHTHPGDGPSVGFSTTDDRNERQLALYLAERIPRSVYASVVLNDSACAARVWDLYRGTPLPVPISAPDFSTTGVSNGFSHSAAINARFDRQVRAFGPDLQRRLTSLRIGVVGVGGLGSVLLEQLARLGASKFVLVDPDVVEESNLNRLIGATPEDATEERTKVEVAARNIKRIDARSQVTALRCTVSTARALRALRDCDVLIAATDDDASRMIVNALACQYLIPLLHVGVNLAPDGTGGFDDISGEIALPEAGRWCLLCSGIVDAQRAARDLACPDERALLHERGYLPGTPAPAVYHLNGVVASLAAAELHNLIWPYKQIRRYVVYRELAGELMTVEVPASERCLYCRPDGLLGLGDLAPLWRPSRDRSALPPVQPDSDDDDIAVTAVATR